jgi:mRNA-degrading endonuclease RelE of RelBE toxin-antitoxin system
MTPQKRGPMMLFPSHRLSERFTEISRRDAQRIRVGTYRVIYEINDDTKAVLVVAVSHRKDAYR